MTKQININKLPLCAAAIRKHYHIKYGRYNELSPDDFFTDDWEENQQYIEDIMGYLTYAELLTPEIEAELFPFIFANE